MSEDPPEAPGPLGLVEAFVNTVHLEDGDDSLPTPEAATAWLRRYGVAVESVSEAERARLIQLREALRDVLESNDGRAVGAERVEQVTRMLNGHGLATVISAEGVRLEPAGSGIDAFYGMLASAMVRATIDGTWRRLKVCHKAECRWVFYDSSKNASRAWCSMRSCGCQAKSRAYRARRRDEQPSAAAS
ncbi:MAG: CGNR zinc finger domain-containing protein [Candidatus Dormibacteria bacterium]